MNYTILLLMFCKVASSYSRVYNVNEIFKLSHFICKLLLLKCILLLKMQIVRTYTFIRIFMKNYFFFTCIGCVIILGSFSLRHVFFIGILTVGHISLINERPSQPIDGSYVGLSMLQKYVFCKVSTIQYTLHPRPERDVVYTNGILFIN